MRKFLVFILFIGIWGISHNALAETLQRLQVVEFIPDFESNGSEGTLRPLSHVEVNVQGASSTVTDAHGFCTLRFKTLQEGAKIIVNSIYRPGYDYNEKLSLNDLIISASDEFIVIPMVSVENRKRQVQIQLDKKRKLELDQLDSFAYDYAQKKQFVIKRYEEILDNFNYYIDHLGNVDSSPLDEAELQAIDYYQRGDIAGAIACMDSCNLISCFEETNNSFEQVKSARNRIEEAYRVQLRSLNDIQGTLQKQISLLELDGSIQNMRKAMSLLEKMLEINPSGDYQVKEYMQLVLELKEYDYAERVLRRNLLLPGLPDYRYCRWSSNLGAILYEQRHFEEAWPYLEDVQDRWLKLIEKDPENAVMLFHRVADQQRLGSICVHRDEKTKAIEHYRNAFNAYLKLKVVDSEFKTFADVSYTNLYHIIRNLCEMDEWALADSILTVAYPRVMTLFSKGPVKHRFIGTIYQVQMANYYFHQNKDAEAIQVLEHLQPVMEYIYTINRPLCTEAYMQVLYKMIHYYAETQEYNRTIDLSERWIGIVKDMMVKIPTNDKIDEGVIRGGILQYTEICGLYAEALGNVGNTDHMMYIYREIKEMMAGNPSIADSLPPRLQAILRDSPIEDHYE